VGYPPGQAPPGGAADYRNGSMPKTVQTELGPVAVRTPRDRDGSFDPQLVRKRQTRLAGPDERVLDLYAGGMSVRDIEAHLRGLYGVEVGRDTISRVTDAVLDDVQAWRSRPLERVYPIVYFGRDAREGPRRPLRAQPRLLPRSRRHRRGRPRSLGDLVAGQRGREVLAGGPQRLAAPRRPGRPDRLRRRPHRVPGRIAAVFPHAWVQTCVVHQIRAALRYVNYRDKRALATLRSANREPGVATTA
jgi:putative transposase